MCVSLLSKKSRSASTFQETNKPIKGAVINNGTDRGGRNFWKGTEIFMPYHRLSKYTGLSKKRKVFNELFGNNKNFNFQHLILSLLVETQT